jgi:hypothetical protein
MQQNAVARAAIIRRAIRRQQQIFSRTFNPANETVLSVVPQNVGLLLGFWVEVSASVAIGTGTATDEDANLTAWGPANLLREVRYDDLSNNTRIQTTGAFLHFTNTAKRRAPMLVTRTNTAYPFAYGNTFATQIQQATDPLLSASPGTGTIKTIFWVPIAYSELDLRGAEFLAVYNATAKLELTMASSAQAFVAATADPTDAVYQYEANGSGGVISEYTVTVHQVYYDQIPQINGAPFLPVMDLSTVYILNKSSLQTPTVNQDYPIPYANFRAFLSTFVIYDNQTGGAYPTAGTDIDHWALATANFTNIFKYPGYFPGVYSRLTIEDDFPTGVYYFDSRDKPLNSNQWGNLQLILNASTVNTGASPRVAWEMFAQTRTLVGASSLPGGAM